MKYTMKDLFEFMESNRTVRAICTDGKVFSGKCFAYSDVCNLEDDGVEEPSLEVGNITLYLSEIKSIVYID